VESLSLLQVSHKQSAQHCEPSAAAVFYQFSSLSLSLSLSLSQLSDYMKLQVLSPYVGSILTPTWTNTQYSIASTSPKPPGELRNPKLQDFSDRKMNDDFCLMSHKNGRSLDSMFHLEYVHPSHT
jgi:hypothetical protein